MPRPKIDSIGCQVDKVLGGFRPTLYQILFDYNTKWLYSFKYQTKFWLCFFLECSFDSCFSCSGRFFFVVETMILTFHQEIRKIDLVKGKIFEKRLFMSSEK